MKHYFLYAGTKYYQNDGTFSEGIENRKYFEWRDSAAEELERVGTPSLQRPKGWFEFEGEIIAMGSTNSCRGCETKDVEDRNDHYGNSTGAWCDSCYNSGKYPYRKDDYFDPLYAGERMEDDY
jgi:hypothetical protein